MTRDREPVPLKDSFGTAAYGGEGWSPRTASHRGELGQLWASCGLDSEWRPLKQVLVHRPGKEAQVPASKVNEMQFAQELDLDQAQAEHDLMVETYRSHGVVVHYLEASALATPNQLYCADLFAMTPQGAVLARPASTVRAGEEVRVAQTLAGLRVPVIKILTGCALFEGADLMWVDGQTAVIGRGLRTNNAAIAQITDLLAESGVAVHAFDLPWGCMHFMGMMRMVDKDLAFVWPRRTPHGLVALLEAKGVRVLPLADLDEAMGNMAFNFVVLGPRTIMLPRGSRRTVAAYERLGLTCVEVSVNELRKANGAMGCMTGIIEREQA